MNPCSAIWSVSALLSATSDGSCPCQRHGIATRVRPQCPCSISKEFPDRCIHSSVASSVHDPYLFQELDLNRCEEEGHIGCR